MLKTQTRKLLKTSKYNKGVGAKGRAQTAKDYRTLRAAGKGKWLRKYGAS